MTDNVTPTQADKNAAKDAYGTTPFELEELFARHRLDAIATQAAENERLKAALQKLSDEAELADPLGYGWKDARNLARAALSAQPSDQERCEYCDGTGHVHLEDGELLGACPTCPTPPAGKARPTAAIEQLRDHQQQLDQDGCFVGVSRQALDEVLQYIGERP